MDGFDEAEIARAIALSIQESAAPLYNPSPSVQVKQEIIEIDDDDDELDDKTRLYQAIAASQVPTKTVSHRPVAFSADRKPAPPAGQSDNPFLASRAEMERERLARQKRLRPDIANNPENGFKEEEHDEMDLEADDLREVKRQRVSRTSAVAPRTDMTPFRAQLATPSAERQIETVFYDGELRQTANMHADPAKDTRSVFRLSEILSPKSDIAFVIMSAYVINFPWMYTFLEPKTPVIVITHDINGQQTIREVLPEWIKTTPFMRGGHGCMHMKFMLIFYRTGRLRVVVSSANLIEYDWRDIENSVWVQDLPARQSPLPHDPKADDFPAAMIKVLRSLNVAPALITLMRNGHQLPILRLEDLRATWDFSRVTVKLVPSIAGKHEGWPQVVHTGHTALMKAIRDMGARTPRGQELMLECQGSSIGTYSTQWMNEFYCSAQGESAERWLNQSRAQRSKLPYPTIKILFPTLQTVRESVLGESGGGTMFMRRQQWEGARFPRQLFHDSKSKRGGVLMHTKMILGTFRRSALLKDELRSKKARLVNDDDVVEVVPDDTKYIGWAYVGSHNFTPSAWGNLSGSDFNPILNVTNFELGIAFPLRDEAHLAKVVCWERPPKKYVLGTDEPWIQFEAPQFVQ